jgi:thiamine pyrophosphokinase
MQSIVVVTGTGSIRGPLPDAARRAATVIAVDGGFDVARRVGLTPTHLVGDLDSITAESMSWAADHGVDVERHHADKDATDTDLALALATRLAAERDVSELVVLAGCDPVEWRPDHLLGILATLGQPGLASFRSITGIVAEAGIVVIHGGHSSPVNVPEGGLFSLLALHGDIDGVSVIGCRWPLDNARLAGHSTLGLSNEATGAVIAGCASGVLTVVVP